MDKLRLGVLGCSKVYNRRIAVPLKTAQFIMPYAAASRDLDKAKNFSKKWDFEKVYGSYNELLTDPKVDVVYCSLPNHLHFEYIKKAADMGKHILCEKPLCLNVQEAVEAAAYCREKGVMIMEALMYKFHPQWKRTEEIVKSGEIGCVMNIDTVFYNDNRDPQNIRNQTATGGGSIYDKGCYAVSSARFVIGEEPVRVFCALQRDKYFKTDVIASAILDFGQGRFSTLTVSTALFPHQKLVIAGTEGNLTMELPFTPYPDRPAYLHIITGLGERIVETEITDQYRLEFDAFAEAVLNKTEPPVPITDSICNSAVLNGLFTSAASGRWEDILWEPALAAIGKRSGEPGILEKAQKRGE